MQHGALGWVVLGCIAPDCEYSEIVVEALADGGHVKNVPRYFCSSSWYALLADTCFEAMFHDRSMSPDSRACVPLHVNSNAMRQECALNRRMQHSVCCAALPVVSVRSRATAHALVLRSVVCFAPRRLQQCLHHVPRQHEVRRKLHLREDEVRHLPQWSPRVRRRVI